MTQEQCNRYNDWVDAYNRVVNASNNMIYACNHISKALQILRSSYKIDGSTNDNNKLINLYSDINDRVYQIQRVVLPYIEGQMRRIANE